VVISRRLGHGSPNIALGVYGHLFKRHDSARGLGDRGGNENEE
jgi:hypothetical protein